MFSGPRKGHPMSVFPRVGGLNIIFTCMFNCISYFVILSLDNEVLFMGAQVTYGILCLCVRISVHCNRNTAYLC